MNRILNFGYQDLCFLIIATVTLSAVSPGVVHSSSNLTAKFYTEESVPFGTEYKDWVANWWQWWLNDVHKDNVTNSMLEQKNCLANTDGKVVFLMNPSFAGAQKREKVCEITSSQGILLNFLTAECDTGLYKGRKPLFRSLEIVHLKMTKAFCRKRHSSTVIKSLMIK